jgi:hypothetical protein
LISLFVLGSLLVIQPLLAYELSEPARRAAVDTVAKAPTELV